MPSPPVPLNFVWTNTGNYPAGANPWNGQPLAVEPIETYFVPGTKPPAENLNYILGQIAGDLGDINEYLENLAGGGGQFFNNSGTLVVPANCFWMGFVGYGGGGGGEGGCTGEPNASDPVFVQGGGGAGAPLISAAFPTHPGDELSITIGAYGAGGNGIGGAGGDGSPTIIACTSGTYAGTTYVVAPGGAGAGCGQQNGSGGTIQAAWSSVWLASSAHNGIPCQLPAFSPPGSRTDYSPLDSLGQICLGGAGVAGSMKPWPFSTGPLAIPINDSGAGVGLQQFEPQIPGRGGMVCCYYHLSAGYIKRIAFPGAGAAGWLGNFAGGANGSVGTDTGGTLGGYLGGCGGGGGGAGPLGAGGTGGNGGNGNASAAGGNATSGLAPATAFSGAGGGGGGVGGQGNGTGGGGGYGGNGASGYAYLYQMGAPPAFP